MSFFEDAVISAKGFGSAVSKKTGQLMDTAKLKVHAADITSEINNRCKALGKAVYEARKSGGDIDSIVDECVTAIDALHDRLDEINRRIAELQNKVCCTSCGATMDPKSLYCSRCGARIDRKNKTSRAEKEESPAPEVIIVEDEQ